MTQKRSAHSFMPMLILYVIILFIVLARQLVQGHFHFHDAMNDFMGLMFIAYGAFKVFNIHGFVASFTQYDLIAQYSRVYAYAYPGIELALGVAYLMRKQLMLVNWITLIVMLIGAASVGFALYKKSDVHCACMGAMYKVPMSYLTLAENLVMALMAAMMIVM